jgi:hypothetical protein
MFLPGQGHRLTAGQKTPIASPARGCDFHALLASPDVAHPDATHPEPLSGEATGCLAGRWSMPLTRLKIFFHGEAKAKGGARIHGLYNGRGRFATLLKASGRESRSNSKLYSTVDPLKERKEVQ